MKPLKTTIRCEPLDSSSFLLEYWQVTEVPLLFQESNGLNQVCHSAEDGQKVRAGVGATSNLRDVEDDIFANKNELDDGDIDDEIDPALKEKIDR